jgi:hypothetical protein
MPECTSYPRKQGKELCSGMAPGMIKGYIFISCFLFVSEIKNKQENNHKPRTQKISRNLFHDYKWSINITIRIQEVLRKVYPYIFFIEKKTQVI